MDNGEGTLLYSKMCSDHRIAKLVEAHKEHRDYECDICLLLSRMQSMLNTIKDVPKEFEKVFQDNFWDILS